MYIMLYFKIYNLKQKVVQCEIKRASTYILWPRVLCRAAYIRKENTVVRSAEEEGKRSLSTRNAHVENGAVL